MIQSGSSFMTFYSSWMKEVGNQSTIHWWVHPRGNLPPVDGLPMLSNSAFNHLIDGEQNFVKILYSKGFSLLARTLDSASFICCLQDLTQRWAKNGSLIAKENPRETVIWLWNCNILASPHSWRLSANTVSFQGCLFIDLTSSVLLSRPHHLPPILRGVPGLSGVTSSASASLFSTQDLES